MSSAMEAALDAVGNMVEGDVIDNVRAWDVYRHPEDFTIIRGRGAFPDVYISARPSTGKHRHVCIEASVVEKIKQYYGRMQ